MAPAPAFSEENKAEEYKFEVSETEKKPYHLGGYLEAMPILFGLDKNASLYKLNFYNRNVGATTPEYDGTLQLEGSLEKGISRFYIKTNTAYTNNYQTERNQYPPLRGQPLSQTLTDLYYRIRQENAQLGQGLCLEPGGLSRPAEEPR